MEKFIVVKRGGVVTKDDKSWVELVDNEDKTHRVFPSMLGSDGVWVHLDKEIDMLKGKIEDGISGLALKLTKEKKGQYWNVIGVEEVKDLLQKEAIGKVRDAETDTKNMSVCLSYAKDLAVAGKIEKEEIFEWAIRFLHWVLNDTEKAYKEAKDEPDRQPSEQSKQPTGQTSEQSLGQLPAEETREQRNRIQQLAKDAGYTKKFADAKLKTMFGKTTILQLSQEELDKLEEQLKKETK